MGDTVYILGAGFSRFAGLPLMDDFYFMSKDIYRKLGKDPDRVIFEKVFDYFDRYSKVKNIINADFYNIEELLSIIEMDTYLKGKRAIYKYYIRYIAKVITESTPQFEQDKFRKAPGSVEKMYAIFLSHVYGVEKTSVAGSSLFYIRKENDSGIISLNYDLLLENALSLFNNVNKGLAGKLFYFDYGLEENLTRLFELQEYDLLKFAKIHGSVNFVKNSRKNLPLIVPPTWNKTSDKKIRPIWDLAYKILTKSEKIVFIGYSLPETDLYVKYLLIAGIQDCYNLKEVEVICPDDDDNTILSRYEKFFDINFRLKAFKFIPVKFEDWIKSVPNRL